MAGDGSKFVGFCDADMVGRPVEFTSVMMTNALSNVPTQEEKKLEEASPQPLGSIVSGHPSGFVALCAAGNLNLLKMFLSCSGFNDFNCVNDAGWTGLAAAAQRGFRKIVEFLVSKGADVNQRVSSKLDGVTALHLAAEKNQLLMCERLLELGAELDTSDDLKRTALHVAAAEGLLDICLLLCESGANVDASDGLSRTALHHAAFGGSLPVTMLLCDRGCNKLALSRTGKTARDKAKWKSCGMRGNTYKRIASHLKYCVNIDKEFEKYIQNQYRTDLQLKHLKGLADGKTNVERYLKNKLESLEKQRLPYRIATVVAKDS